MEKLPQSRHIGGLSGKRPESPIPHQQAKARLGFTGNAAGGIFRAH
jgi:hypothetical protein